MNIHLQKFARQTLKIDLCWCSEAQKLIFKRMYSHTDLTIPIDVVVDNMPAKQLNWAMQQVKNTLITNEHIQQNTCF